MKKEQFEFLEKLIDAPSPSGYEGPAAKVYRDYVKKYSDLVTTDVMGSVIAVKNPDGKPKIMLAGHIDEIGLIIHYIDDKGFLYFHEIGGIDPGVLPGCRVSIYTEKGPIVGVIGRTAIHLIEREDRGKALKLSDLWIDIGVKDKKEAQKLIRIGDPATVSYHLEKLQGDLVVSRAFDDKAGVFVIAEVLRLLQGKQIKAAVYATATTQEELGHRGARTSAFSIDAEVGIAIDVTHGNDFPTSSKTKNGEIDLGKGPVITRGANITPRVEMMLSETGKKQKIPIQLEAHGCSTGTDANIMQMTKSGMATGLVSIPLRYMHTPSEVMSMSDLENAAKLIAAFIEELEPETDWTP
jgi:endoglucanase